MRIRRPSPLPPGRPRTEPPSRKRCSAFAMRVPKALWGAAVNGSVFFDFYGGDGTSLDHIARLRTADIQFDWTNTSVMVGQDKPLIAPRDPFSLAQVGVSPFTAAGNLWLWSPQARVEQRFKFGDDTGLRAQLGLYEMGGTYASEYRSIQTATWNRARGRRWRAALNSGTSSENTRASSSRRVSIPRKPRKMEFRCHRACSVSTGLRIRGRKSSLRAHFMTARTSPGWARSGRAILLLDRTLVQPVQSIGGMDAAGVAGDSETDVSSDRGPAQQSSVGGFRGADLQESRLCREFGVSSRSERAVQPGGHAIAYVVHRERARG